MTSPPPKPPPPSAEAILAELMTPAEVCARLGIWDRKLRRLAAAGELVPFYVEKGAPGKSRRKLYTRSAVEAYRAAHQRERGQP